MGSYISIGFIAEGNKKFFLEKCIRLIGTLDKFTVISVKYPTDDSYSAWVEQGINESKLEDVLEYCFQYEMAEIQCHFDLENYYLEHVLIRIKHVEMDTQSLLLEVPEENDIFKNIDFAESAIISLLQRSLAQGFKYAFCDSEADIPLTLAEIDIAKQYSIFVNYEPECKVCFSPWKIDGISDR